jgi:hypothetical protein
LDGRIEHRDGELLIARRESPEQLNALLVAHHIAVRKLRAERPNLEQVVLERAARSSDRVERA